jgi:hypothetical protein
MDSIETYNTKPPLKSQILAARLPFYNLALIH